MLYRRVTYSWLKNAFGARSDLPVRSLSCTGSQAMRFVQYKDDKGRGLGIQADDGKCIVSLSGADRNIPIDMVSFLQSEYSIERLEK
jgi:hypothetical protein